jgi:hypothetical protein
MLEQPGKHRARWAVAEAGCQFFEKSNRDPVRLGPACASLYKSGSLLLASVARTHGAASDGDSAR